MKFFLSIFLALACFTDIGKAQLVITQPAPAITIAAGKSFTVSNTLTLTGTDGSNINIGAGGNLGTAAFTAATAYEAALGNPGSNGYVLSSTTGGTRSWIAPSSFDATAQLALTNGTAATSKTTGTLVVTGGVGVSGQIWATNVSAATLLDTSGNTSMILHQYGFDSGSSAWFSTDAANSYTFTGMPLYIGSLAPIIFNSAGSWNGAQAVRLTPSVDGVAVRNHDNTAGAALSSGTLTVGAGTAITSSGPGGALASGAFADVPLTAAAALSFGSIAPLGTSQLSISIAGAAIGDSAAISIPEQAWIGGELIFSWFTYTDTIYIRAYNPSVSDAVTPPSCTFGATVFKH